jgi:hypothetical protein
MTDVVLDAAAMTALAEGRGTPEQATAALAQKAAEFRKASTLAPTSDAGAAKQRLDSLVNDFAAAKAFWDGNVAVRREVAELHQRIANGFPTADAIAGAKSSEGFEFETTFRGEMNSRTRADAVASLRSLGMDDPTVLQAIDGAPVSPQEVAMAKMLKAARLSDAAWTDRWLKGGLLERSEMTKINVILSSVAA